MATAEELLKQYWGYDSFRGIQREIIDSITGGHDTLGLMPTGGGKSVCFQVPALAMDGVCLVVTPLIALMKDQVHHLRQKGIIAAAVYSGMTHDDVLRTLDNCILGRTKLLYISPERLASPLFLAKLRFINVSFITVDEAHCISQWGYDFRPSYLQIARLRDAKDVPVLALTATATPAVVKDIQEKLTKQPAASAEQQWNVFQMSFERKNLTYSVMLAADKRTTLIRLLQKHDGAAIVYVRSRRHAREIAELLDEVGLSATFYHAGLDNADKDERQRAWQHDRKRIIVATNAFGMGIDKADVRLVVHFDCPDSIEAYFQEAGRAGRDGQQADAILLYNGGDRGKLEKRIADTFPPKDYVRQVYDHLAYYYQIGTGEGYGMTREFDVEDFCQKFRHYPTRVTAAIQILERAGYMELIAEQEHQARVHFLVSRDDLYRLHTGEQQEEDVIEAMLRNYGSMFSDYAYIDEGVVARACDMKQDGVHEVLKGLARKGIISYIPRRNKPILRYSQRREDGEHIQLSASVYDDRLKQYRDRIHAMLTYAQSVHRCRSRQLLEYFGEKTASNCGHCDVCQQQQPTDSTQAVDAIMQMLADGRRHHLTELYRLHQSSEEVTAALRHLLDEEHITQRDGFIFK